MFSGRPSVPLCVRPSVIHVVVKSFRDISSICWRIFAKLLSLVHLGTQMTWLRFWVKRSVQSHTLRRRRTPLDATVECSYRRVQLFLVSICMKPNNALYTLYSGSAVLVYYNRTHEELDNWYPESAYSRWPWYLIFWPQIKWVRRTCHVLSNCQVWWCYAQWFFCCADIHTHRKVQRADNRFTIPWRVED